VTKAPPAPPVREADDPEYATNLRRATVASTVASALGRYHGVAVTREFSAVIAGGLAGVLGAILIATFDGSWVPLGVYTFVLAAITFGTTFIAPETQGRDLLQVEDALDDVRAVDDVRAGVLVSR
jgi:MHS family metabolite:H+ symporter-like MFS transporter